MKNLEIAGCFTELADLLEILGEIAFKVNAYRRAARELEALQEDVAVLRAEKRLKSIPGIGDATASKIGEYLDTGRIARLEEVRAQLPAGLLELTRVPGLGPKGAAQLHKELGIEGADGLRAAIAEGRLAGLKGMGEKKIENLRKGLEFMAGSGGRVRLGVAHAVAQSLMQALRAKMKIPQLSPAGSLRRMRETIGDVDLLAATEQPEAVLKAFVSLPGVEEVLAHGETKASVRVHGGLQVDLRAVPPECFGAAMQYFTGSKEHNVRLRERARRMGLKINEYAVTRGELVVAGATEEEVYEALGLAWIPPELREDHGELDLAERGELPQLVTLEDIQGDLHCHTRASDGELTLEELADEAIRRGYRYVAVTDHSRSAGYAGGLSDERLLDHVAAIRAFNSKQSKIRLLAGTESDIRVDGSLDYPDELLAQLDWVVASIHSAFGNDPTARLERALSHPATCVLGHPSGRLLLKREGYEVDWERVFRAAVEHGKGIEINASDHRLDLDDVRARRAAELGIPIVINTDMHHPDNFDCMRFGVGVARRAGLTKEQVVNTRSPEALEQWRMAVKRDGGAAGAKSSNGAAAASDVEVTAPATRKKRASAPAKAAKPRKSTPKK